MLGETLEGIDDVVGAERRHVGGHGLGAGPAFRVLEAGQQEIVGQAGIGGEGRRIRIEIEQVNLFDAQFVLLDDDEGLVEAVESAGNEVAGLAAAADDVERRFQLADAAHEAVGRQRVLETLVLEQGDQRDDRIRPADDGQVDADGDP